MSFPGDLSFRPVRPQNCCRRLAVVVLQATFVALVITVAVFYLRTFRYGASLARRDRDIAFLRGGDAASCRRGTSTKNRINASKRSREAHLVDLTREGSKELDSRGVQNLDTLEWDTNAQMRALLSQVMCKTAFGVMASSVKKERSLAQSETWMAHFHRSRTVIMSDKSELDLNTRAVPRYNKSSKACAQQRSIESVLSAYKENPEAEYIIGIDDDTFVNLFALARILVRFPVDQAAMGGYIVQRRTEVDDLMNIDPTNFKAVEQGNVTKKGTSSPFAWPWGGAGMIFNRKAVAAISEAFRTGVCQRTGSNNDTVFARCREKLGIWLIHTPLLEGTSLGWSYMMSKRPFVFYQPLMEKAVIHKVEAPSMFLLYNVWTAHYGRERIELFEKLMAKQCK